MKKIRLRTASLLAAGALVGGASMAAIAANAAGSSPSPSPSTSSSSATHSDGDGPGAGPGGGHAGEKALTGADLTKATDVAKKAVSGGTVDRAETDSGDAAYEVHMTKSDGSKVTVKLDKSFQLKGVEDGMGK